MWGLFKRLLKIGEQPQYTFVPKVKKIEDHQWTEQQTQVIKSDLKPTLVVSGPGTGKTFILAQRFAYLVNEKGIDPRRILVVTFTRKATANMKQRILSYISDHLANKSELFIEELNISTFHQFALRFITNSQGLKDVSVVEDHKARRIAHEIIEGFGLKIWHKDAAWEIITTLRRICKKEQRNFTEDDVKEAAINALDVGGDVFRLFPLRDLGILYYEYDKELLERKLRTFDDLVMDAYGLLKDEDTAKRWGSKYDAILIDEFQDLDDVQFEILKQLSIENKNIFAVGDPDQSIFGFRGAMPDIFKKFKDNFGEETQIFKLEKNFRSTPEILDVANALINVEDHDDEFRKELFTDNLSKQKVYVFGSSNEAGENDWIFNTIVTLLESGVRAGDIAVLFRGHKYSEQLRERLEQEKIPFYYAQDRRWKDRPIEIYDFLNWLTIALDYSDRGEYMKAVFRLLKDWRRGVKDPEKLLKMDKGGDISYKAFMNSKNAALAKFRDICRDVQYLANREDLTVTEKVRGIIHEAELRYYSRDSKKVAEIIKYAKEVSHQISSLQEFGDMVAEGMRSDVGRDALFLSTIHGAKGLEFKYVFLMRFSRGCLPSSVGIRKARELGRLGLTDKPKENIAEERRLAYVALTRAKECLYISFSENPSSFLNDIRDKVAHIS